MALLDKQPRSATVTADEDLVCYELSEDGFHALTTRHPRIAIHLLMNIGAELSRRLRRSTADGVAARELKEAAAALAPHCAICRLRRTPCD